LLEGNYHTQDIAVIVITKATSVLHLINLKKQLFYTKILTSDFYTDEDLFLKFINEITEEKYELNFISNDINNLKISHYPLYGKKNTSK
jgi:hypothetical protein